MKKEPIAKFKHAEKTMIWNYFADRLWSDPCPEHHTHKKSRAMGQGGKIAQKGVFAACLNFAIGSKVLLLFVRLYQAALSPFLGHCCRFFPTCSEYACEAIEKHGALKGSWLAIKRICRCHPFHKGGFDPVP